jgi:hypothetical protein
LFALSETRKYIKHPIEKISTYAETAVLEETSGAANRKFGTKENSPTF